MLALLFTYQTEKAVDDHFDKRSHRIDRFEFSVCNILLDVYLV